MSKCEKVAHNEADFSFENDIRSRVSMRPEREKAPAKAKIPRP
jgi:hypothetical protein